MMRPPSAGGPRVKSTAKYNEQRKMRQRYLLQNKKAINFRGNNNNNKSGEDSGVSDEDEEGRLDRRRSSVMFMGEEVE
ncbi:hypothetical protein AGDE_17179 [Angomonas deanei]|nr:hypothetical protein AGDE_17179 [Angomonas deanei]|eukprot:EPY15095.1 hypothetical protein AGDE_17179 [Angomonas deanei]